MRFRHGIVIALLSLAAVEPCFGWTAEGHNIIEAIAYRRLLDMKAIPRLSWITGKDFSGKDVLDALIAYRVLDSPHRWGLKMSSDLLASLPVVRSGNLDKVLSRQFEGNSQCFHFMAEPSDVYWDTTTDPQYGYPHMLYDSAYPRVVAFMTSMFYLVLNNVEGSHTGDHDVYALMHTVADSYSPAHCERDIDGKIIYLKVWQPAAFIPYIFHPQGWAFFSGPTHHRAGDKRDNEYFDYPLRDSTCNIYVNPWQVGYECLSDRGKMAVEATEELLITLCDNVLRNKRVHGHDTAYEHRTWNTYVSHYFAGYKGVAQTRYLRPYEREWRPLLHFGLSAHSTNDIQRAVDYTAGFNLDIHTAGISPLMTGLAISYGLREYADHTNTPVLKLGYTLAWQFSDSFELRTTPLEREFLLRQDYVNRSRFVVSFLDAEAIIDHAFWIRLESPHWTTHGWIPNDYGISIGYANPWDLSRWISERVISYKERQTKGDLWEVPTDDQIMNSRLGTGMSASATIVNFTFNPYYNSIFGPSAQLLWDRNANGVRRIGFANGVELLYGQALELGYMLRYYLRYDLAITSDPIIAVKPFPTEQHPSGELTWDAQSTLGFTMIAGHTDFTLGIARLSWRDLFAKKPPLYQSLPEGVRVAANFYIP